MPSRLLAALLGVAAVVLGAPAATASAAAPNLLAPPSACPNQTDPSLPADVQETAMICMVNHARADAGVAPLSRHPKLLDAAARKALDIVTCGEFSHTACGLPFSQRITESGYAFRAVGENIAYGTGGAGSVRSIMAGWLDSAAHRANLLSPVHRDQGIAVLGGPGTSRIWVNHFARAR